MSLIALLRFADLYACYLDLCICFCFALSLGLMNWCEFYFWRFIDSVAWGFVFGLLSLGVWLF